MMSANPLAAYFIKYDWVDVLISVGLVYIFSCIITILFSALKNVGTVLKYISFITIGLYDLLALFCIIKFKTTLEVNIIETLLATNANEIREFFAIFFPWWLYALVALMFATIITLHYICNHKYMWRMGNKHASVHLYIFIYIVIVMLVCHKLIYENIANYNSWVIPFENLAINLKDYEPERVQLQETSTDHPEKIVLIIGESHSKGHCSIYGYEKETNPCFRRLINDSLAYAFQDVVSPATATTESFKYILNTRHVTERDKDWYLFPSIITIMKSAGYRTSWFSNQDEVGLFDNMASCYAHICDKYTFNDKEERLDGNLLDMYEPTKGKEMIIYHLMGQHVDFSKRYPVDSFSKFTITDYDSKRYHNREVAAHYDNACLYNDFVISSIFNQYREENAIVIYFSDHGLDVFQSSPDYFGHVHGFKKNGKHIGFDIPFIVFMTEKFQKKNPATVKKIQMVVNKHLNTGDIPFFIMDVSGYLYKEAGN